MVSIHKTLRLGLLFVVTALGIEFLDELVDGVSGAAWPLIRSDLKLPYGEIGWLLTLPALIANLIEPAFGVLADLGRRRALILGGGLVYALALALMAVSSGFWTLLAGLLLYYPAAGAFVSLMQAAWMDAEPLRREQNMARWTLAGSVGNVVGPLLIGLLAALHLGWRPGFGLLAALMLGGVLLACSARRVLDAPPEMGEAETSEMPPTLRDTLREAVQALKRGEVRRYLWLLECGNLMLDIFRGFLALYFVDVVGGGAEKAALAVAIFTGVGLIGDALLIALLERVSGLRYLRLSAWLTAAAFAAFLLVPAVNVKLALLGLLGLLNAGWYAILQAKLYGSLPERSGVALALGNVANLLGGLFPLGLGLLAERFGLGAAMWALMLGPLALMWGLRRVGDDAPLPPK